MWDFIYKVAFRLALTVLIGVVIGSERAKHGRAAGIRTHVLVCMGAALTSLIGVYAQEYLGNNGDMMRIAAQVISGIGFLGAGMIILKDNNVIMGLTTAAGVWTTAIIGIAVGCGFYAGAIIATILLVLSLIIFARLERRRKSVEVIYVEIDDMYRANVTIENISALIDKEFAHKVVPPKSGKQGNLGINFVISRRLYKDITCDIRTMENVVYTEIEQ